MRNLIVVLLLAAVTITGLGCRREKITYEGKIVASTIYEAETNYKIWKLENCPMAFMDSMFTVSLEGLESDTVLVSKIKTLKLYPLYVENLDYQLPNDLTILLSKNQSCNLKKDPLTLMNGYIISYNTPSKRNERVKIGASIKITQWQWVNVLNEAPIKQEYANDTLLLVKGETCGVEIGGRITVVDKVRDKRIILVKYTAPGKPLGTPCPSGVVFAMRENTFLNWNEEARFDEYIHGK